MRVNEKYSRIQNGLRMYLLAQKYMNDERQLLNLLNPLCYR